MKSPRSILALLFCFAASLVAPLASAQTGGTFWRLDRSAGLPYKLQFNADGPWSVLGEVDGSSVFSLTGKVQRSLLGLTVEQYGSNTAAATAALAAGAAAKQPVGYTASTYNFATAPTGDNVLQYGWQTTFLPGSSPPGMNNSGINPPHSLYWQSAQMTTVGNGVAGSASQIGALESYRTGGTPTVSNGKWSRLIWNEQNTPTDYGAGIYNDQVGEEVYAVIGPSCSPCRTYALHTHTLNNNTGAGYFGSGIEIEMDNLGTAQTSWGTQNSNVGASIVAYRGVTTGAISLTSAGLGGTFYDGIWINAGTVTNSVFRLASDAAVWKATGQLRIGQGVNGASPIVAAAYVAHNWNGYDFLAEKTATGNAAARFEATNAAAEEYIAFVYKATKSASIGYDNTGRYFAISGQEGVAGSKYVEWDDTGIGTYYGRSKFAADIWLINATSNGLYFGNVGLGAPGAASAGQKIQLYGTAGTVGVGDTALGVRAGFFWFNGGGYEWYVNSALKASLSATGDFAASTLKVTPAADPGSPLDGQFWANVGAFRGRLGAANKTFAVLENTQTWTGAQTFTGGVTISGGVVQIASAYITTPAVFGGLAASSTLALYSTGGAGTTDAIDFYTGTQVKRWSIPNAGHFAPAAPATYNLGDPTNTVKQIFRAEYEEVGEMTAPASPAANKVRIYAEDNGAGKTRLMALFATGAAQQIAIEP